MALPWEKREDESPEAFEAFVLYRDGGVARSLISVASELNKSVQLLGGWSSKHGWVKRCHAFDSELDRRKLLVDLREIEDMRKRQTRTALMMQELGNVELQKMLKQANQRKKQRGDLDEKTVLKLIEQGAKLERLNRGEPGEIVQNVGGEAGIDLTGLSLNELKALRYLRGKVRAQQLAKTERKSDSESSSESEDEGEGET